MYPCFITSLNNTSLWDKLSYETWRCRKSGRGWGDTPALWSLWVHPPALGILVKDEAVTAWPANFSWRWRNPRKHFGSTETTGRQAGLWAWERELSSRVGSALQPPSCVVTSLTTLRFCLWKHWRESVCGSCKSCLTTVGWLCCCPEAGERTRWVISLFIGSAAVLDGFTGSVLGWEVGRDLQNPATCDSQE